MSEADLEVLVARAQAKLEQKAGEGNTMAGTGETLSMPAAKAAQTRSSLAKRGAAQEAGAAGSKPKTAKIDARPECG